MTRLDEIQARLDAATPGPWEPVTDNDGRSREHSVWADGASGYVAEWMATRPDAEFVARAPSDLAVLVDAVKAVQALHKPGLVRLETLGFDFDTDEYRTRVVTPCAGCHHEYPCPTAKALDRIGGAS